MLRQLTARLDRLVRLIVIAGMVLGAIGNPNTSYAQAPSRLPENAPAQTGTETPTETATLEPSVTFTPSPTIEAITTEAFTLTVTPEPSVTITVTATPMLTVTPVLTPTNEITPTATITPTADDIADIDPITGGELKSKDGKVKVKFPAGAVKEKIKIKYKANQSPNEIQLGGLALVHTFDLSVDKPNNKEEKFDKPVKLTISLDQFSDLQEKLQYGQQFWIGYWEPTTNKWVRSANAVLVHDASNNKTYFETETDHFSTWGFGITLDAGWLPLYNEPQTALFSGGATYNFPIEVPAGRLGVQPSLNLNYNSRQIDGVKTWTAGGWVGMGWDVDLPYISRDFTDAAASGWFSQGSLPFGAYAFCKPKLTLVFGGVGYNLVVGENVTGGVRYYTQEHSQLYIERRNWDRGDTTSQNSTGEYWLLRTPDGTRYRFGFLTTSEMALQQANIEPGAGCVYAAGTGNQVNHGGKNNSIVAVRWGLDEVVSDYVLGAGQQQLMTVSYLEEPRCGYPTFGDKATYPTDIYYNKKSDGTWGTRIAFELTLRPSNDGHGACDKLTHQERYLSAVRVEQNGEVLRKYVFGYEIQVNSGNANTRLLNSITPYGRSGGGVNLPATTILYTTGLHNRGWDSRCGNPNDPHWLPPPFGDGANYSYDCEVFGYKRMAEVRNGYGARTTFSYANDGRSEPNFSYNYQVTQKDTYDGINASPATVNYAYWGACYSGNAGFWGNLPGSHDCPPVSGEHSHALSGYSAVTETVRNYDNTIAAIVEHNFRTSIWNSKLLGKENYTTYKDGSGNILSASHQEHGILDTAGGWFSYVAMTHARTYDRSTGQFRNVRTSYGYDGWGNKTGTFEYGAEEIVRNAGFDLGIDWWGVSCTGCTTPARSTDTAFLGVSSVKLQGAVPIKLYQDVAGLTPGTQYRLRVWVKSATGATAKFQASVQDGVTTLANSGFSTPSSSGWQEKIVTFTAPASGTVRLQLEIDGTGSGAIYADEVALAKLSDVGDERSTYSFHFNQPNGKWLIGLPWGENRYGSITPDGVGTLLTQRHWYYDYQTPTNPWDATGITKGQLTRTGVGDRINGPFIFTRMAYDPTWGNVVQQSMPFSAGGTVVSITIGYESTYNFYPITRTAPAVNGVSLSESVGYDYTLGKVTILTDTNGQITTASYDGFGRLYEVYKPGDVANDPSLRYRYYDVNYNLPDNGGLPLWTSPMVIGIARKPITFGGGYGERHIYDGLGREIQVHTKLGMIPVGSSTSQDTLVTTGYNALGKPIWTTVPYVIPAWVGSTPYNTSPNPYSTTNLTTTPKSSLTYDALGRTTSQRAPDGTVSSVGYTDRTVVNADANGHYRINTLDAFGRTQRVDETLTTTETFADAFASLNTSWWTTSCQGASAGCQSIDSGTLKNIGTGSNWNATVYRASGNNLSATGSSAGMRVEFKVDSNPLAVLALQSSSDSYLRFGINIDGTRLYAQYGNVNSWVYPTDLINPIQYGAWYVLELRVLPNGQGLITVFEKNNPSKSASFVAPMPSGGSYRFQQWMYRGNAWLDNYSEFQPTYQPTQYTYNALDQLTRVTDALNNITEITYNPLGQKTSMTDPDMGYWTYEYDPAGNLTKQTDALGQALWFKYDVLGRLQEKRQTDGTGPLLARFTYDSGSFGLGQRTVMSDATGITAWRYDNRGRVISETRTITATALNASYTTLMDYDLLDRVVTTTYPTGEVVTNTYTALGLSNVRSASGGASFNHWYAHSMLYDVAGRLTNMTLNNGLVTTYTYAAWTSQGGRLQRLQTGALLDFNYTYDAVGNILSLTDGANSNQAQTFGYDALDRLISASTNAVGNGQYSQTWGYNAIGNISTSTLTTTTALTRDYVYGENMTCGVVNRTLPHAASQAGTDSFDYDCNGNMISRTESGVTYLQQFNIENQLAVVTNTANSQVTTFYYDGNGKRVLLTRSDGTKTIYPSGLMEVDYAVDLPAISATATYTVDRTDDPASGGSACLAAAGDCSLRGAISKANTDTAADTIVIPAGTYTLAFTGTAENANAAGDLDITNPVTIVGAGPDLVTIKTVAGWNERVFHITSGKTATIRGVTVTGGNQATTYGGGLLNEGTLTISQTVVFSNTASGDGGGIQSFGTLTLLNSTVLSNTANGTNGGGGLTQNGGTADLTNVTFSGNRATVGGGGGVYLTTSGLLTITNGTLTSNFANTDGGGLRRGSGTLRIQNTIVAGNTDGNGSDPDCDSTITSSGYNHIGTTAGCSFTPTTGDVTGSSANLTGLADAGGHMLVHMPKPGSAVINAGSASLCLTLDQRGYSRNGTCDKGAAEYAGLAPTALVTKTYYFAGAQLIALREITSTGSALYFMHQDHLGSSSLTTNSSGAVVSRQLFYAYGEVRWSSGTMPTTIGYTSQRRDTGLGSLMFYNARYYSPLLSRFISADTIVPGAGNPQAFNRYMYVLGNPLKFTDPSGHDVMLIGGMNTNVYDDPASFAEWVKKYKGWDDKQWANFYRVWMHGTDTIRSQVMNTTGVHFFNYDMGMIGYNEINGAMIQALSDQMVGMQDTTLVGYSKGASLVMAYMAAQQNNPGKYTDFKNPILIKPAYSWASQTVAAAPDSGPPFLRTTSCALYAGCTTQVSYNGSKPLVNVSANGWDGVTAADAIVGAINISDYSSQGYDPLQHGNASGVASQAYNALDISGDRNSGTPWSSR